MTEEIQKSVEERIKEMNLDELIDHLNIQRILCAKELRRSESLSFVHRESFRYQQERDGKIFQKYNPIIDLLTERIEEYV